MTPASILLIDDHAVFRFGLSMALSSSIQEVKVFEADSISSAMLCAEHCIDLVLLDIKLPGLSGMEGIALLKRQFLEVPILMISSQDDSETIGLAITSGAVGFISKLEPVENVVNKIQLVLCGQHSELAPETQSLDVKRLTLRQCEVLNLLHQGLPNKIIAHKLSVSESTVHLHVRNLLLYFNAKSRAEVVFAARSQKILG